MSFDALLSKCLNTAIRFGRFLGLQLFGRLRWDHVPD